MIHVRVIFKSGVTLDFDVDQDILISDFIELAGTGHGPISLLEFLP